MNKMSKLLENKQIIHVVSEAIIICSVCYYFNSKMKAMMAHIEDLSIKLEEQSGIIDRHEQIIRQLVDVINSVQNNKQTMALTNLSENVPDDIKTPKQSVVSSAPERKRQTKKQTIGINNSAVNESKVSRGESEFRRKDKTKIHKEPPMSEPKQQLKQTKITFAEKQVTKPEIQSTDLSHLEEIFSEESDLDAELADELGELSNDDSDKKLEELSDDE
jgi:hypothetical protein